LSQLTPTLSNLDDPASGGPSVVQRLESGRQIVGTFMQNRLAAASLALIAAMVLFCFLGPVFYKTNQTSANLLEATQHPSSRHLLGTTDTGFDVLGRLMVGGRTSLEIGLAAGLLATTLGVAWGATAGFFGGFLDGLMMRIVDSVMAVPPLFLIVFLAVIVTPRVLTLVLVIALTSWLISARLIRGETLTLRTREYVYAVRVMGGRRPRIIIRHIIPNAIGTVMVNASFQIADAILMVAYLSYLGLGIPPPAANWGDMLSNGVQYIFSGYWWLIYPPGICIVVTVVAFNFLGDALRDAFEVRLQRP
jgi:peptide/nickel transport system permease protein